MSVIPKGSLIHLERISKGMRKDEIAQGALKCVQLIYYMVGIAERGRGQKCSDNDDPAQFLLEYVKDLEQQLTLSAQPSPDAAQGGECGEVAPVAQFSANYAIAVSGGYSGARDQFMAEQAITWARQQHAKQAQAAGRNVVVPEALAQQWDDNYFTAKTVSVTRQQFIAQEAIAWDRQNHPPANAVSSVQDEGMVSVAHEVAVYMLGVVEGRIAAVDGYPEAEAVREAKAYCTRLRAAIGFPTGTWERDAALSRLASK